MVHALGRTPWRVLKNISIKLYEDTAIPHLGIHSEKVKILKDSGSPVIMAARGTTAKTWSKLCVEGQMNG